MTAVHTQRSQSLESVRAAAGWRIDPTVAGGGLFFETACQTCWTCWTCWTCCSDPWSTWQVSQRDRSGELRIPDTVSATYRFGSGVIGTGLWCYSAGVDMDRTTVYGASGSLSFATTRPEPIELRRGRVHHLLPVGDPPHVHQSFAQTILDQLNAGPAARSNGRNVTRTGWVTDQVLQGGAQTCSG